MAEGGGVAVVAQGDDGQVFVLNPVCTQLFLLREIIFFVICVFSLCFSPHFCTLNSRGRGSACVISARLLSASLILLVYMVVSLTDK